MNKKLGPQPSLSSCWYCSQLSQIYLSMIRNYLSWNKCIPKFSIHFVTFHFCCCLRCSEISWQDKCYVWAAVNTSDKQPSFLRAISSSLEHIVLEIFRATSSLLKKPSWNKWWWLKSLTTSRNRGRHTSWSSFWTLLCHPLWNSVPYMFWNPKNFLGYLTKFWPLQHNF